MRKLAVLLGVLVVLGAGAALAFADARVTFVSLTDTKETQVLLSDASNQYTVGDQITLTASFTASGTLVDPTTVSVSIHHPGGSILTPSPTKISVGVYQVVQSLDAPGDWQWKAIGTGAAVAASSPDQGSFRVLPQAF